MEDLALPVGKIGQVLSSGKVATPDDGDFWKGTHAQERPSFKANDLVLASLERIGNPLEKKTAPGIPGTVVIE
jgi:hypothetical protein